MTRIFYAWLNWEYQYANDLKFVHCMSRELKGNGYSGVCLGKQFMFKIFPYSVDSQVTGISTY